MAPQTPQQVEHGIKSSRTTGVSSNTPPPETELQRRHHVAHHDTANATTGDMTLDAQLNIVRKTGSSKNKKQHPIGCKYSGIAVNDRQLLIYHAAGVCPELRDQLLAACNGKPPC